MINITDKQLTKQIEWAIAQGWLNYYQAAAATYSMGVFDVADYMAITSRETNFQPKYLKVPGDNGHGFGPMQADGRSFHDWITTGAWKLPDKALLMGAHVLATKYAEVRGCEGHPLSVTDHSKKTYSIPKAIVLTPNQRYAVSIAAYNCGLWSLYHVSKGRDFDFGTTGADYAHDVSSRAIWIRTFLSRHEAQQLTTR